MPKEVFLASSSEGREVAERIAAVLEEVPGRKSQRWDKEFRGGDITFVRILSREVAGALIVATPDDDSNHLRRRRASILLVALLAGGLLPASTRGQTPQQACHDPVPKNCARARFLGEDKGCACFVCNPDSRTSRKVVCTREEADKRALFKRVPPPAHRMAPTADVAAPVR